MPATVVEFIESRDTTMGRNSSGEMSYKVFGTEDHDEARQAILDEVEDSFDLYGDGLTLLPRETIRLRPLGGDVWEATVRYSYLSPGSGHQTYSFDTDGGTEHITQSKATIARYAASGTASDFKGAIGVTSNSIEGVDIDVAAFNFTETHRFTDGIMTEEYKETLKQLTNCVNDAEFKGHAAGECRLRRVNGSRQSSGVWELQFQFSCLPNIVNKTVGTITGINAKGWEYIWIRYEEKEDTTSKRLVMRPIEVFVEKVYEYADFEDLGIGT